MSWAFCVRRLQHDDRIVLAAGRSDLVAGIVAGLRWPRIWLALTVRARSSALCAALRVLLGGENWEWHSAIPAGRRTAAFAAGRLERLVSGAGVGGGRSRSRVFPRILVGSNIIPTSAPRGRAWWSAFLLSMGLVLTVSNGLHFLIAWELFAVCGYFLITLDRERSGVRAAGWLYLAASHAGTMCLFAFFALLAARTGSWDLGPMREHPELAPLFWLALFGFGVKAGFFPLHIWLPSAHANAPSHVSAIMSGVAIKMGLYGIVRFSGWLPVPAAAGWVVTGLGATSALLGIAFAFAQNDFKRLLAYCSVENMGIILIGVGVALLAVTHGDAPWGTAGAGRRAAARVESRRVQIAVVLRRRFGAARHRHAGNEPAGRTGADDAVDRRAVRARRHRRRRPAAAQRFCQRMAGLSRPVRRGDEQGSHPRGSPCPPSSCWRRPGPGAGEFRQGRRDDFPRRAAHASRPLTRTNAATGCAGRCWRWPACVCAIGLAPVLFWPAMSRAVASWHPAWAAPERARAAGHAGLGANRPGDSRCGGRRVAVAEGARATACGAA